MRFDALLILVTLVKERVHAKATAVFSSPLAVEDERGVTMHQR